MQDHRIKLPQLAFIAATRGMLGFGAGLLLSPKLSARHRTIVGTALLGVGVLSTIPIAVRLLRRRADDREMEETIDGAAIEPSPSIIIAEVIAP